MYVSLVRWCWLILQAVPDPGHLTVKFEGTIPSYFLALEMSD